MTFTDPKKNQENPSPAPENSPDLDPDPAPKPKPKKFQVETTEVIDHLNDLTGRNLSTDSKQTSFIRARLTDGHTVDQLKHIIDHKAREWLLSPKMKRYLIPKTLFNKTNFENYLGEIEYLSRIEGDRERLKIPINNYLTATRGELIWTHDEEQALAELADKLRISIRAKGGSTDLDNVERSLQIFLEKLPEWHSNKFSIINLNRHYNEIVNEILRARKNTRGNASEWEIMRAKINERKAGQNWA